MKISLSVTHDCNLRCKYCYAGEKFNQSMDIETAKKIVDFSFIITPKDQEINFSFFGGEPLLQLPLIKEVIAYIESKSYVNPLTYSITTNGTIINDEIIDFVNDKHIKLCISIDGSEHIHDKNRVDKNGHGSLQSIMQNMKRISNELNYYQVNAVYGPETIEYLDETVKFFIKNNIRNIHLNPDILATWKEESFPKITEMYGKVGSIYIDAYKNNKEIAINLLDSKIILFFKGGYESKDKCGMGETEFGFAPSGNVYPCERLIGNDTNKEMMMGNIHTGINPLMRCTIGKKRGNSNEECVNCPVQKYCMNWCGCTNYNMTGSSDKVDAMLCHSERSAISVAKYVFEALQNNQIFLNHIFHYSTNSHTIPLKEVSYV